MRFGTFLEFSCPPGADTAECYARAFEHVDQAEAVGLDIVDVAEFHFTPNRVASSPVTLAAAIAGRTKRIRWARRCSCFRSATRFGWRKRPRRSTT